MQPDGAELLSLLAVGIGTAVILVGALVVAGFVVLVRRNRRIRPGQELQTKAGSLLLRLDDEVRSSEDEVEFAIAQFGSQRTREYADALAAARADLAEGFRLRQLLDDAYEDTDRQRREWTLQIIANCERAQRRLTEQRAAFADLRRREVGAAATLSELQSALAAARERVTTARTTVLELNGRFAAERTAGIQGVPDAADRLLDEAEAKLSAAAPLVSASGVHAVSADLDEAALLLHRAGGLLDQVDATAKWLTDAGAALQELVRATTLELEAAKPQRDAAPDAQTGGAIIEAMAQLDLAVASAKGTKDPVAVLDRIDEASGRLDLALAGARNQQQRLAHARDALAGALVSARSQIGEAKSIIGGAGVEARTRLAEAERQLALAQVEADPVEALDTARRAITLARDADALARYDAM